MRASGAPTDLSGHAPTRCLAAKIPPCHVYEASHAEQAKPCRASPVILNEVKDLTTTPKRTRIRD